MSASLIISIYRLQKELPMLLSAISQQSRIPDEIIFAEDDISDETIRLLEDGKKKYPQLTLRLVQQEDRGFRKAEIVNKAVSVAAYEKLVFMDGDCLPHCGYVNAYAKHLEKGKVLSSRLVRFLAEQRRIFEAPDGTFRQIPFYKAFANAMPPQRRYCLYIPFYWVRQRNSALRGSSWACMKSDFMAVNGYDERFCVAGYGFEDTDISRRLNRAGASNYVVKFQAIYYHFLDRSYAAEKKIAMQKNKMLLDENDRNHLIACERGINQWMGEIKCAWEST